MSSKGFEMDEKVAILWRTCPNIYKQIFVIAFLVGVGMFGFELTNFNLSIDEEVLLHSPTMAIKQMSENGNILYEIVTQGRPLTALWYATGYTMAPFISILLALLVRAGACVLLVRLLGIRRLVEAVPIAVFYAGFPFIMDQIAFSFLAFSFALIELLAILAVMLVISQPNRKGIFWAALSFATCLLVYQAVILYGLTIFLLWALFVVAEEEGSLRQKILPVAMRLGVATLISMGIYFLVVKLSWLFIGYDSNATAGYYRFSIAFNPSVQLEYWRRGISHAWNSPFYTRPVRLMLLLVTFASGFAAWLPRMGRWSWPRRALIFIGIVLVLISPATLSLILGRGLPERALTGIAFFYAGAGVFILRYGRCWVRNLLIVILPLFAICNMYFSNKASFDQQWSVQADRDLANRILDRIYLNPDFANLPEPAPVAILGLRLGMAGVLNHEPIHSSTFGQSFFAWDDGNPERMLSFIKTLGISDFTLASPRQHATALTYGRSHKPWPDPDSVAIINNEFIVISLAPEIVTPFLQKKLAEIKDDDGK